jgi:GAF domain-containing protein
VMGQLELRRTQHRLTVEKRVLELLQRVSSDLSAELELETLLQKVTDAATTVTGAQFGAFFYNSVDERGDVFQLFTLAGAARADFERLPMPRKTAIFQPTFDGRTVIRADDITQDERYGRNAPRQGLPQGHLPVRSYLAVPVVSRSGEVFGGLLFGHPQPGVFSELSR